MLAAAADARRLGHGYIGTEHFLLGLLRTDPNPATQFIRRLDVESAAVSDSLRCWLEPGRPAIDPAGLATLGIDYDAVVGRLEQTFGAGALERPETAAFESAHASSALSPSPSTTRKAWASETTIS